MPVGRILGAEHLCHAVEFRGLLRDGTAIGTGAEDMDVAAHLGRRRDGLGRRVVEGFVVVFCEKKNGHIRGPPLRF